jgi:catechol 2,3-dioxygenase-like lactoylglutathione lyase family enzyme
MVAAIEAVARPAMPHPNLIILYVDAPLESAKFYGDLLGLEPLEAQPTFAMFQLDTGVRLGLWSRHTVEPASAPGALGGRGELAFAVPDVTSVQMTYADWRTRGLTILQPPVDMDFGHTFTALDPDGHRLRVYTPF